MVMFYSLTIFFFLAYRHSVVVLVMCWRAAVVKSKTMDSLLYSLRG